MSPESGSELLRQLARRAAERARSELEDSDADQDPRIQAASQPLDETARARIVQHLEQLVAAEQSESEATADQPEGSLHRGSFRRKIRWALPLAAGLMLALSLFFLRAQIGPGGVDGPTFDLPTYALQVEGVAQAQRNAGDPSVPATEWVRVAPGNRLRVILTPDQAASGEISAYAFTAGAMGRRTVDPARIQVSEQGAVRLDATVGTELEVPQGDARLVVVLGLSDALPTPTRVEQAMTESGRAAGTNWWAVRLELELVESP